MPVRKTVRRTVFLLLMAGTAAAQNPTDQALLRGLDFERQGRYDDALGAFRQVLGRDPANAQAMLGAERIYAQQNKRDSTLAMALRALAVDRLNNTAWTVRVRTARALGGEPLAAAALAEWMAASPESESPYRELVRTLLAVGRHDDARQAVENARRHFRDPSRLRAEMAQVEASGGNWARAAAEWRAAVVTSAELVSVATFNLMPAPAPQRDRVVQTLVSADSLPAPRRLAAELLLGWNQPERAWQVLLSGLPADPSERRSALQAFADRARAQDGQVAQRMAAAALERIAGELPPTEASRYRIESARAFSAAGDQASARRVLRSMADDPNAPSTVSASATATLVELYARDNNPAEAQRLLDQNRVRLAGTEAARLGLVVARGWIAAGDLARAEATVSQDSSLAADEVRGWVALYRGDLASARELLRVGSAPTRGPDAARNVERAGILAVLQAVGADSVPALGAALYLAARGDTARASRALVDLARTDRMEGKAELLAVAARFAAAAGDREGSEALWREVADRYADQPPAPAALLALARLLAARGDQSGAIVRLEALILNYPGSALVPEARRELDRVRNLVPRS